MAERKIRSADGGNGVVYGLVFFAARAGVLFFTPADTLLR